MATYNPIHVGYDVTFVGEDEKTSALNAGQKEFAGGINKDDITCAICHLILREPVQAVKCGHRFCTKCIGEFHQTNPEKCPMDWQTIQVFPDIGKKREILNLQIRCQNHEEGCVWQNEIRELENHLKNCGYQKVPCELKCGENVLQKNMPKHLVVECRMILRCAFKDYGCTFKDLPKIAYFHYRASRVFLSSQFL
uniref:Uncharacterized protein n=1 Tax=Clytia hemisphaerica TaxID=252671 RepID=A0A7M5UVC7_9CNID